MIGMIVLYIKIFRVLHGQMSKLLVWLTEVKMSNGRRTSTSIVFDHLTGTAANDNGPGRGPASTGSNTSNFHQQTARCSIVGSINNINYIHHHRLVNAYNNNIRTMKTIPSSIEQNYQSEEISMSTKQKFRRAVHAIVWLGRARDSVGGHKGSFKEYRENSRARSNRKLFYTSNWSSAANDSNPFRRARNSTYRRAISTSDSLLQRQISVARRQQQQKMRLAKQRRVARTLGVLIFVFLVSWLPFTILWPVQRYFGTQHVPNSLLRKTLWLTYANTFINPFLYFFSNNDFRYALRRILKCFLRQNVHSQRNLQIR